MTSDETPIDLDAIRRRLERALDFIAEAAPDGVRDQHKTRRAAYILAVNDVPALFAEVNRMRALIDEVKDHVGEEGDGEIDVHCLRELLAGRRCAW